MRISKYRPLFGIGFDGHGKMVPNAVPPPPPGTPQPPVLPYIVIIVIPISEDLLTGKWSQFTLSTEGMGAILWQHDWGPLQVHIPLTPPFVTISIALLTAASSHKYFLPSFSVQEKIDGAFLAKLGGGGSPVAVSTPAYIIPLEECWDFNCAKSFNLPVLGIGVQCFSTRWVACNGGDIAAGLIGVATDAASALMLSHFGGKIFSGNIDNKIFGLFSNLFMGSLATTTGGWGAASAGSLGGIMIMAGAASYGLAFLALPIAVIGGKIAEGVGEKYGSKPEDSQPLPSSAAPAAPAPAAPPPPPPSSPPASTGPFTPASDSSEPNQSIAPPSANDPPTGP